MCIVYSMASSIDRRGRKVNKRGLQGEIKVRIIKICLEALGTGSMYISASDLFNRVHKELVVDEGNQDILAEKNQLRQLTSLKAFSKHLTGLKKIGLLEYDDNEKKWRLPINALSNLSLDTSYLSRIYGDVLNKDAGKLSMLMFTDGQYSLSDGVDTVLRLQIAQGNHSETVLSTMKELGIPTSCPEMTPERIKSLWNFFVFRFRANLQRDFYPHTEKEKAQMLCNITTTALLRQISEYQHALKSSNKLASLNKQTELSGFVNKVYVFRKEYIKELSKNRNQIGALDFLIKSAESLLLFGEIPSTIY